MNKVELIGRLTKDAELKETQNEVKYCHFTLAVDRRFKDASGQRQTDFIGCTAWRQTASFIAGHFKKGDRVAICGSIQTRSYEDENGTKRMAVEVIADEAEFVDSNNSPKAEAKAEDEPKADEALPFEI